MEVKTTPAVELRSEIHPGWSTLLSVGSVAAWLSLGAIPLLIVLFVVLQPPLEGTVQDWFEVYQESPLKGLISLDFLMVVVNMLQVPVLLALAVTLWSTDRSLVLLAGVIYFLALAMSVPTNPSLEFLALSRDYAAASPEEHVRLLAAGQGLLSVYTGTAWATYYVVNAFAGALFGWVQTRSPLYPRAAGWLLLAGALIGLALFIPVVGAGIAFLGMLLIIPWFAIVAVWFRRLA